MITPTTSSFLPFSLSVATVNGSGSQSANTILAKALFRMGWPVGVHNLFPSNIAGLPTWFSIRVDAHGYTSRRLQPEIVVAKNAETLEQDLAGLAAGGFFFYSQDFKNPPLEKRSDIVSVPLPFRELTETGSASVKMRKLLTNMVYVGVLAELLQIDAEILKSVVRDQFAGKAAVVEANQTVVDAGRAYAREHLQNINFPYRATRPSDAMSATHNKILIDGNSAAGLGSVVGGCTVFSWYPITPSTSLAESFEGFARDLRRGPDGKNQFAVVQAEDELSAIGMVVGAGWAGARAMTATSGPGLSLMAEIAGLSYYAEIPAVVWDVQRAGPSTGLPTRTLQGDLTAAAQLSHGDTEHIVLLPANPGECFEFAQIAFDLAEEFQTLVIVLSDLDIGMNLSVTEEFQLPSGDYRRGKVLDAAALNEVEEFARYRDVDGDGVPYRTLPGTLHPKAAFFTRGTGHTEFATYSEDGATFAKNLERLKKKFFTAAKSLPAPVVKKAPRPTHTAVLLYGSSDVVSAELQNELHTLAGVDVDIVRVRALPFSADLANTLLSYERVFVVEQNRDGQMRQLLAQNFPTLAPRFQSVVSFDGLPLSTQTVLGKMLAFLRPQTPKGHPEVWI